MNNSNCLNKFFKKSVKDIRTIIQGRTIMLLIRRLDELGFYKHVDKQVVEEMKKKSKKSAYLYWDETQRIFQSDAEDLAEGFIELFYKKIEPFLLKEGVSIQNYVQIHTGGKYEIFVSGKKYMIYDDQVDNNLDIWELAANRTFSVINLLLQEAGSSERLYSLYGGNDLFALFLTEEMFKAISKVKFIDKIEKPAYIPDQF